MQHKCPALQKSAVNFSVVVKMVMIFWNQKTCFLIPLSLKHLNVYHHHFSMLSTQGKNNGN